MLRIVELALSCVGDTSCVNISLIMSNPVVSIYFGCQPDEPLAFLVTTNMIINVYCCCNVTHVFCPSLFVFCWE